MLPSIFLYSYLPRTYPPPRPRLESLFVCDGCGQLMADVPCRKLQVNKQGAEERFCDGCTQHCKACDMEYYAPCMGYRHARCNDQEDGSSGSGSEEEEPTEKKSKLAK